MAEWQSEIDNCIDGLYEEIVEIRRHLHAHPEPSGKEINTAHYVTERLAAYDIPAKFVVNSTGVIADSSEEKCNRVAVRSDMDALRIRDEKDTAYQSTVDGVMHACGHDAHTAIGLGACIALKKVADKLPWAVPWRGIFQPSEEVASGALEMIAAGALENVSSVFALHVQPLLDVGEIAIKPNENCACCEFMHVVIKGKGGHTARPHLTTDPIRAAAPFLESIYSFDFSKFVGEEVAVAFGNISAGTNPNVIPDTLTINGSVRGPSESAVLKLNEKLKSIAAEHSRDDGATIEVTFPEVVAPVINDPAMTAICREACCDVVGEQNVSQKYLPSLGGEDFGEMLKVVPGCMFRLGTGSSKATKHPLHSSLFDIDESALAVGAKTLARSMVLAAKDLDN